MSDDEEDWDFDATISPGENRANKEVPVILSLSNVNNSFIKESNTLLSYLKKNSLKSNIKRKQSTNFKTSNSKSSLQRFDGWYLSVQSCKEIYDNYYEYSWEAYFIHVSGSLASFDGESSTISIDTIKLQCNMYPDIIAMLKILFEFPILCETTAISEFVKTTSYKIERQLLTSITHIQQYITSTSTTTTTSIPTTTSTIPYEDMLQLYVNLLEIYSGILLVLTHIGASASPAGSNDLSQCHRTMRWLRGVRLKLSGRQRQ